MALLLDIRYNGVQRIRFTGESKLDGSLAVNVACLVIRLAHVDRFSPHRVHSNKHPLHGLPLSFQAPTLFHCSLPSPVSNVNSIKHGWSSAELHVTNQVVC